MSRQFTFKTTKDTADLEEILNSIPASERSSYIRKMLQLGIQSAEITQGSSEGVVPPRSHKSATKVTPQIVITEAQVSETELEDRLNSIKF